MESDDEFLERYWALADELEVLDRDALAERAGAILQGVAAIRLRLAEMAYEPGRPRKPIPLFESFSALWRRFQALAVRSEVIGLALHEDDLLADEEPGAVFAFHRLDDDQASLAEHKRGR